MNSDNVIKVGSNISLEFLDVGLHLLEIILQLTEINNRIFTAAAELFDVVLNPKNIFSSTSEEEEEEEKNEYLDI
jgi:hypothetical protein